MGRRYEDERIEGEMEKLEERYLRWVLGRDTWISSQKGTTKEETEE